MKRRGLLSLFLPAAAVAQSQELPIDLFGGYLAGERHAEVTPGCSWLCSCSAVMWPEPRKQDSPGTMRCMNGNCANFNVPFVIPTFTAYQQHTATEKEKEEQQ